MYIILQIHYSGAVSFHENLSSCIFDSLQFDSSYIYIAGFYNNQNLFVDCIQYYHHDTTTSGNDERFITKKNHIENLLCQSGVDMVNLTDILVVTWSNAKCQEEVRMQV